MKRKRVLLAPLDWGLGHATRCIPVINELQDQGCEVIVAGSGDSLALLQKEFPDLTFFFLPAYAPRYPLTGSMVFQMARQLPHFVRVISDEHRAVEKIIAQQDIDVLISDNRYGCWSSRIPSVFITHQNNILMPERFGFLRYFVKKQTQRLMNRFHTCWIPDVPSGDSLAGDLMSFGKIDLEPTIRYVGWLSRFQMDFMHHKTLFDVLAIFSGPEPQRTLLENTVVPQLRHSGLRFLAVRGLPSSPNPGVNNSIVDFLPATELQNAIRSSALVVARSGYSTLMDMRALGKKVIFVPTPGQTEQEYLANRLMEKKIAYSMSQDRFDLTIAINESKMYSGFQPSPENDLLREAIRTLIL